MIDFQSSNEISIKASPEAVFDIVSDLTRRDKLAGSGEVLRIRKLTEGPVGMGTLIEADEHIELGDQKMDFTATSVVVAYDPPKSMSWIPVPPIPIRRIQWWYHLSPEGAGTKVVQEVEVDLGEEARFMMGGTENYQNTRGADVARGMAKTLENLRQAAER